MTRNSVAVSTLMLALTVATAARGEPRLDVRLAHPAVAAGTSHTTYLRVALQGSDGCATRAPVNLALVLDRSRSMRGDKIRHAREAARALIDMLGANDVISVVAYGSTVEVLMPAMPLGPALGPPADRSSVLASLTAQGESAMFAGLSKGVAEVRKHASSRRINRIVLLSDGRANIGPTTPSALRALGVSLRRQGISVTTIGLDRDYDEDLLTELAAASDANHALVEDAADLTQVLGDELRSLFAAVAGNVDIRVQLAGGARVVRSLGRQATITGDTATAELSQLYSGQEKYLLFELEVPPGEAGHATTVAEVEVDYTDLHSGQVVRLVATASVRHVTEAAAAVASDEPLVLHAAALQLGRAATTEAIALIDAHRLDEARAVLRQNAAYLRRQAEQMPSSSLDTAARRNSYAADEAGGPNWELTRKGLRHWQHGTATQQSY